MKSFKIVITESTCISKKNSSKNYSEIENILIGRYNEECFRGIINFKLPKEIFNKNICKADLIYFFSEFKIDENIESFMLNISRNLTLTDIETVCWNNAPKFFQSPNMCCINRKYVEKYIIIDVKTLLPYYIKNNIKDVSLSLIGLSDSSIISLSKEKRAVLKIEFSNFKDKLNKKKINLIDENINKKDIENNLVFGNFINNTGEILEKNSNKYIKFNLENNNLNSKITNDNDGICIFYKGYYSIEYNINCISDSLSLIEFELNGEIIEHSKCQFGEIDATIHNSLIIYVENDNMILRIRITSNNFILIASVVSTNITLIKID